MKQDSSNLAASQGCYAIRRSELSNLLISCCGSTAHNLLEGTMSKVFGLLVVMAAIAAVLGTDMFPSCRELLVDFGDEIGGEKINLFTNADSLQNTRSVECVEDDHR